MIRLSLGPDITTLLDRVAKSTDRCREVTICSPFIDEEMWPRLVGLLVSARAARCALRVITTPAVALQLRSMLPGHRTAWRKCVIGRYDLHAKIYLSIARRTTDSEAIVTSANLTRNGVSENIELGFRVLANSDSGRQLLHEIRHFVSSLAA